MISAILVGLWVSWGLIDEQTVQLQTTRPIITGPVVGLMLGDLQTGLVVGATVELMFLAVIFVGTAVPPDPTLSAALATAFAVFAGGGTEVAIASAIPVALIGQIITTVQYSFVNVAFMHIGEKYANKAIPQGIAWSNALPLLMNFIFYGVPAFLAVYFGAEYVTPFIESIPDKIIDGLAVGGGMIGAVGFALLLTTIKGKSLWPYFVIGFIFAAYLGVNSMGIGILAITAAALHFYLTEQKAA